MTKHVNGCTGTATCVDVSPRSNGWYDIRDSKLGGDSPLLEFHADELDAFAAAWLAGRFGNDPQTVTDAIENSLIARIAELEADYDVAFLLLNALVDGDDCWFDHHGGCQAHGFLSLEPGEKCPHAEAKELLASTAVVANGGEQ